MKEQDFTNVTGKFLIASPYTMEGNVFHKSLIYVLKHGEDGAAGLICNHQVRNTPVANLFKKANSDIDQSSMCLDVYLGGPVDVERGFFLHSSEYSKNLLFEPSNNDLAVSSNLEILSDIVGGKGPQKSLFIVGYTAWGLGQMEFELSNNLWIIADSDSDLIFSEEPDNRWKKALRNLGLQSSDFAPSIASC